MQGLPMAVSVLLVTFAILHASDAFLSPSPACVRRGHLTANRGKMVVLSSTEEDTATATSPNPEVQSRKAKSKEQVRNLLKGLGELDDDDADEAPISSKQSAKRGKDTARKALKDNKGKLEPEQVFFEGGPHWSEVVIPTVSILTVIGIIPFVSSVARQIWVKYKITSRRISVTSGLGGQDLTEVIYADIAQIKYAFRAFGQTGDMVLFLRDGARLEMKSIPNFRDVFSYIRERLDPDAQDATGALPVA